MTTVDEINAGIEATLKDCTDWLVDIEDIPLDDLTR
jgi:hypothetical protein